ncbi:hypothetical protein [Ferribacterium limneticum]|uniref:hypothetical protein n=1 Tax=Ferribacterium limneticum TaxID=76259 RepID=UPI001CF80743|nr:hypothetical protein [Ferribacterium limneticum]UCV26701.1 hypothetical protein KI617_10310 [Ferribacterium limneticum]UCV30618.1 hypothetical protein KI608_10310 [Ferribacterium limneticum]
MSSWKVTMPKGSPAPGKVQVVCSIKTSRGYRGEFSAEKADERHTLAAWRLLHASPELAEKVVAFIEAEEAKDAPSN